ncbi:hypothetical protein C3F00_012905 [Pseudomonas sp. MWU13-2860]|nr:hypothetical protein C3F00_012905 [Pseudomonas sp. MWU13-2860]
MTPQVSSPADLPHASDQSPSASSITFNVFNKMVEADEDFLGLLAYALYKRHKIEWIRSHDSDNHEAFKQVACTPQQVRMYRDKAEQLAKNFIDESLDQLGAEMKETIANGVIVAKIESLKPGFWRSLGNHTLSGIASVAVALALFGLFTFYSSYQENGGLEGRIKQMGAPLQSYPANQPQG